MAPNTSFMTNNVINVKENTPIYGSLVLLPNQRSAVRLWRRNATATLVA